MKVCSAPVAGAPTKLRLAGLIAAVLAMAPASSQDWQVFDMANAGLPSNTITALAQDHDGAIWVGTDWGLCRFMGGTWTVYQTGPGGLPSNSISTLAVDSANRLWVGTVDAGIGILDNGTWGTLNTGNSPLVAFGVRHIHHDHRGWTWISTELGLHCIAEGEWRLYNDSPSSHAGFTFFGPNVRAVDVRSDGLVAVATINAGLTYLTETEFVYYTVSNSNFPDNSANAIAVDAAGDRWLACPSGGLIRHAGDFIGGPWFQYNTFTAGFPDNSLTSIAIDVLDRKYLGTETAGVLVFEGPAAWYTWTAANSGLPDDRVVSLLVDSDEVLWVGTYYGGLARRDLSSGIPALPLSPIRVFPNPFNDHFLVHIGVEVGAFTWELADPQGRVVAQGVAPGNGPAMIHPAGIAPGGYVLRAQGVGWAGTARLVAQ